MSEKTNTETFHENSQSIVTPNGITDNSKQTPKKWFDFDFLKNSTTICSQVGTLKWNCECGYNNGSDTDKKIAALSSNSNVKTRTFQQYGVTPNWLHAKNIEWKLMPTVTVTGRIDDDKISG